ncbi:unnamed protein product, partial [Thelazia callipaeda]|uniref:ANK_REP_REGION domain-containing protein n=1 Tax=Thelazia callipaeda TaxID=103827 RepID=A0A0N5D6K1_THECL
KINQHIYKWLSEGDIKHLEQLIFNGQGYLLANKTSTNPNSAEFLNSLTIKYQSKIDAIHKAVEDGDIRRLKSLINRNEFSTARDRYGMTPLHIALIHGQTNTVRYLLAKYPSCVNATNNAGRTALHYAAADPAREHMIKKLQKAGADGFIEDKLGHTPFYYRTHARRLHIRVANDNATLSGLISGQMGRSLLKDLEEDISNWIHTGNVRKLEDLVLNGYADLLVGRIHEVDDPDTLNFLDVLPQYQAKIDATHKAIEMGDLRAIRVLVDRKKMAFCRDARHLIPLHKALLLGQMDIAKYLIKNYPQSTNAMDEYKRTPLHYAAALRDDGYLYKIMRHVGGNPEICDCFGRPPKYYLKYREKIDLKAMKIRRHVAPSYLESVVRQWIQDGNVSKLELLVLSGCGDLLLGHSTNNPISKAFLEKLSNYLEQIKEIHKAIRKGELEKVKELLSVKKLALARNRRGFTPLHTAIVYEQTDIIRYIAINFPSVLNAPDYNKRTPMHYAAATRDGGHYLHILSKAGANPLATDNEEHTVDYYRRNTMMNLKSIKEDDDEDVNLVSGEFIEEASRLNSPQSDDSLSFFGSPIVSMNLEDYDEHDKQVFEFCLPNQNECMSANNKVYLAKTVAPVLTMALSEVFNSLLIFSSYYFT